MTNAYLSSVPDATAPEGFRKFANPDTLTAAQRKQQKQVQDALAKNAASK